MPRPAAVVAGSAQEEATHETALHQLLGRQAAKQQQQQLERKGQQKTIAQARVHFAPLAHRTGLGGAPCAALGHDCGNARSQHCCNEGACGAGGRAEAAGGSAAPEQVTPTARDTPLSRLTKHDRDARQSEQTAAFLAQQDARVAALRKELLRCRELDKHQLPAVFDGLVDQVRVLQASLTRATAFLAPYEIQKGQKELAALEQLVRGTKARLLPRKDFSFERSRARQVLSSAPCDRGGEGAVATAAAVTVTVAASEEKSGEHVVLRETQSNFVQWEGYCDSTLHVASGELYALKLSRLRRCTVVCGPVRGSVFVEQCSDCVFVLCAAQLRIHNCERSEFRIVVQSDPVIEDCSSLVFSPKYDSALMEMPPVLPDGPNKWANVRDFNAPIAGSSRNFALSP